MRLRNSDERIFLLLTGTIDPQVYNVPGGVLADKEIRLEQYITAIHKYARNTAFTDIIFIENSGYELDVSPIQQEFKKLRKNFEFIKGTICREEIAKHGKSYGEALLIHEAVMRSQLLKSAAYFYKVTGRLFLENHKAILKTRSKENEFILYSGIGWCCTFFFKVYIKDYLEVLDDVYQECDEKSVNDIEICYYKRLYTSGVKLRCFNTYPFFGDARMGGNGPLYSDRIPKRWIRNIMSRMQFFSINTPCSKAFELICKLTGKPRYMSQ